MWGRRRGGGGRLLQVRPAVVAEADILEFLLRGGGLAALEAALGQGGAGVPREAGGVEGLAGRGVGCHDGAAGGDVL